MVWLVVQIGIYQCEAGNTHTLLTDTKHNDLDILDVHNEESDAIRISAVFT